jgi:WD40 repeat protein
MKTWKPLMVLPLGEDPPAITSLCFNHNGKILAASATDGMIHMFDMSAGLQITGWPAHDSPVSSVLFGPAETSIFSLGSDGKVYNISPFPFFDGTSHISVIKKRRVCIWVSKIDCMV